MSTPAIQMTTVLPPEVIRRTSRAKDPVPSLVVLFVANFALQRISAIPGASIPFSTVLVLGWTGWAYWIGLIRVEWSRLRLWLGATSLSAIVVLPQLALVQDSEIRPYSWAFWSLIWLPGTMRLRDANRRDFERLIRALAKVGLWLSGVSSLFVLIQYLGVPYRDVVAEIVPEAFQVQGFVISYPLTWDSEVYRSNGWLALEPSFMSFLLGVCLLCALVSGMKLLGIAWIGLGILATVSGSGVAIVLIGLLIMILTGRGRGVSTSIAALAAVVVGLAGTPFGQVFLGRSGELFEQESSASMRAIRPYDYLTPRWFDDSLGFLFGHGAGSSRTVLEDNGIAGLLLPNVGKVMFDYGLIAGAILLAVIVSVHRRGPDPVFGLSLLISLLLLQAASQPFLVVSFLVVSWWAPAAPAEPRVDGAEAWREWVAGGPVRQGV